MLVWEEEVSPSSNTSNAAQATSSARAVQPSPKQAPVMPSEPTLPANTQLAALILRVLLGAWFMYSGGGKVFVSGLDRFTRDVANYKLVSAPLVP